MVTDSNVASLFMRYVHVYSGAMFSIILLNKLKCLATQIWLTGLHPSFLKSAIKDLVL